MFRASDNNLSFVSIELQLVSLGVFYSQWLLNRPSCFKEEEKKKKFANESIVKFSKLCPATNYENTLIGNHV